LLHPSLGSCVIQFFLSVRLCAAGSGTLAGGTALRVCHLPHGHDGIGILDPSLAGWVLLEHLLFGGGLRLCSFRLCHTLNSSDTDCNGEEEPTQESERCAAIHDFSFKQTSKLDLGKMNPAFPCTLLELNFLGRGLTCIPPTTKQVDG
jgi:hypothetical protein